VVASIRRVSDVVAEISSASMEQSTGIDEINRAVAHMDEATQQNTTLVEQATSAAQALSEQARHLSKLVSVFRLNDLHYIEQAEVPAIKAPVRATSLSAPSRQAPRLAATPAIKRNSGAIVKTDGDDWETF